MKLILALLLAPQIALAQTAPAELLAARGLLGVWAEECGNPVSLDDARIEYQAVDGVVVHTRTTDGMHDTTRDTVLSAKPIGEHSVEMVMGRDGQATLTVTVLLLNGHLQTWRSVRQDGTILVSRAQSTLTQQPMPTLDRCSP